MLWVMLLYVGSFGRHRILCVLKANLASIVCYACALMGYWVGLFLEADREALGHQHHAGDHDGSNS